MDSFTYFYTIDRSIKHYVFHTEMTDFIFLFCRRLGKEDKQIIIHFGLNIKKESKGLNKSSNLKAFTMIYMISC